ncbi:MAG: C40 family peptidase [Lachnospiraceae bacterium]|nr:C40 family peptidase [Lachnospiraceae bacterium]MEE1254927.1 C40 family peptidase [Lachnospiraceae bacterium]
MNKNSLRIAACAFAGTLALSGYHTSLQARIATPSLVPAAGIAVVLEERATIQDLTQEVIQNIAYLESASGIQPNIVIASEKVAKAETPAVDDNNDKKKKVEFRTSAGFSVLELSANGIDKDIENQEAYAEETEETTTEEEQDFSSLVIAQVNNYVNVRSIPSEEGEIVGKLYDDSVGEYIEEKDGWYKIISGKCEGYVKAEYCVTGEDAQKLAKEVGTTYAVVNTTTLKVRKEASTESAVLGLVPIEEELIVKEELDGWVKIEIEEGDGYVSRDYVNLRTDFVHAESKEEEEARLAEEAREREAARAAAQAAEEARAEKLVQKQQQNQATTEAAINAVATTQGSQIGKAVADYALQFVGNPYVYGGTSLTNGTDCSGFVLSVYANFGVSLPHSSSAQRSRGYEVGGIANAQPGDIVCYSGHVGIYIGNGQIVHASSAKTGIKISTATYKNILAVRRIF